MKESHSGYKYSKENALLASQSHELITDITIKLETNLKSDMLPQLSHFHFQFQVETHYELQSALIELVAGFQNERSALLEHSVDEEDHRKLSPPYVSKVFYHHSPDKE